MQQTIWTLAHLEPEQERLVKEAEATLGGGLLLAYRPADVNPTALTPSQLECLRGLEQKLGVVLVAVKPRGRA
jgi:hypothetical protein